MPKVAIIILTINQKEKTLRCLRSLHKVKYKNKRIILFDNGSDDKTLESVKEDFPYVIAHYSNENIGASSGRNSAADIARILFDPDFFLFLDNDTIVEEDFVEKLLEPFYEDESVGISTSKIKCIDNKNIIYAAGGTKINFWLGTTKANGKLEPDDGRFDVINDCISSTGCMLVKAHIFYEINGFDPVFNPYGYEDLDFSLRVLSRSYRILYIPNAVVYHESEPSRSPNSGKINENYMRTKTRNQMIFLFRYATSAQKFVFLFFVTPLKLLLFFARGILTGNTKISKAMLKSVFLTYKKLR